MMIANGVDLVNAAAELGHATASTTLNIYAHQVARARAEASGIRAGAFAVLRQYRINATIRIIQQVPNKNCG